MASAWGDSRNMWCPGCGVRYDDFRTGMTFADVRRLIISIHWCTKRQRVKNGRRNGVLGYWHELKLAFWDQHVGECTDAAERKGAHARA